MNALADEMGFAIEDDPDYETVAGFVIDAVT